MRIHETEIGGVFVVEPEPIRDERGFFARVFCVDEFAAAGLITEFVQSSVSFNEQAGTLRGLHFQAEPHAETKLVRCTRGAIFDVVVDLRPDSPTYRRWLSRELTADNRLALYIPPGCAHGFQTLVAASEVLYHITPRYHAPSARGVRWNDPAFGIVWPPAERRILSERDSSYPDVRE